MTDKQVKKPIKFPKIKKLLNMAIAASLTVIILTSYWKQSVVTAKEMVSDETNDAIAQMCQVFNNMRAEVLADPVRVNEVTPKATAIDYYDDNNDEIKTATVDVCTIEMDGHKMQYTMEVIGDPDEYGHYPLYIALHGGGGGPAEINNEQWLEMMEYYRTSITDGIYVCVRGMDDVWNLHFLDESYAMYDRLIEDMILLKNVEPNRVYLLGFSAGGDGVYAIAPRMADRFAAVNMSSGHPNGVSLENTSNLPFEIQLGIRDFYSEDALRSVRGAEYEAVLKDYSEQFDLEYPHRILIHVPEGHNYNDFAGGVGDSIVLADPEEFAKRALDENWLEKFLDLYESMGYPPDVSSLSYGWNDDFNEALKDYVENDLGMELDYDEDCNAITYVSSYLRKTYPTSFVWDLSTRAPGRKDDAFYWLKADFDVNSGAVYASFDEDTNTVTLFSDGNVNGEITVLATPFIMDYSRPLTIMTQDQSITVDLKVDEDIIAGSLEKTGDVYLAWTDEITIPVE